MLLPALSVPSLNSRFAQLALLLLCALGGLWIFLTAQTSLLRNRFAYHLPSAYDALFPFAGHSAAPNGRDRLHPIDHLLRKADIDFQVLLHRQTWNVTDGAAAYRKRRGRQPPPGFDAWYAFARRQDAVIVEEFFDQIYDDLNPFWGVPARQIREQAHSYEHRISVRDGVVSVRTDDLGKSPWIKPWSDMVNSVSKYLPDLDMPINHLNESRVVVPWEEINGYMQNERASRKVVPAQKLKRYFESNLAALDENPPAPFDLEMQREGPYWDMTVMGCPPNTPARNYTPETDFRKPPPLSSNIPESSFEGYVLNWTFARSPCDNPTLQGLHGTFVEPVAIANTKKLFPLFSGSKLRVNNDILLPPAMYWTDDPFYSGGNSLGGKWKQKRDELIWRGAASGGRNSEENWTRFQRHRFVSMVNASNIDQTLKHPDAPVPNFVLPEVGEAPNEYDLAVRGPETSAASFVKWVASWSDAAMVHLNCFPDQNPPFCPYTDEFFSVEKMLSMKHQYNYKYLPDLDGDSTSGRYRASLLSSSLPIKATIHWEWHDSRLVPWRHFAPMDNTFIDIYGIMEYFLGSKDVGLEGHDAEAEMIALEGQQWAQAVLRKEDMSIYVFRLLLEYARLCDDDRDVMGWSEEPAVK